MNIKFKSWAALIGFGIAVAGFCFVAWIAPDLASQILAMLGQWISSSPAT